jgi:hypothetical protein
MRCVVHLRRSFDLGGQHFVLRLFREFDWESRRSERFTSSLTLVERLASLGLPRMDPGRCFPEKGGGLDAVWTNIEVPQAVLEDFGRTDGRVVSGGKLVAA